MISPTHLTNHAHVAIPAHLTDGQLLAALQRCTRDERRSTAELVAHLAEMDARQIHLREGFASLFSYCCEVLRLSESATYKRIEVARAVRRHPVILDRLGDGSLNLTTARLLAPHLTPENVEALISAAAGRGKRAVEEMLARRFPRPDVPALVRKLPARPAPSQPAAGAPPGDSTAAGSFDPQGLVATAVTQTGLATPAPDRVPIAAAPPVVIPLSADRYQIRFTASASTQRKLAVARELLRHAVPSGDPGEIFDRALTALIAELERKKCATVKTPVRGEAATGARSRHIPAQVRRTVWARDQGRCAFVSRARRRCRGRGFLEFHHVRPYAAGGPATAANIQLRCRAHNAYESTLFYADDPSARGQSGGEDRRTSRGPSGGWRQGAGHLLVVGRYGSTGPGAS